MPNLAETGHKRFELLHHIYRESQGDQTMLFSIRDVASALGLDLEEAVRIAQYLEGELLIKVDWHMAGGFDSSVCITHWGVCQVEQAESNPQEPTQYFPAIFNIIHAQTIIGSQIQQSTEDSRQTGIFSQSIAEDMIIAIQQAKAELSKADLDHDDRAEAEAEIQKLEAQINSPRPKPSILRQAWAAILRIAEAVAIPILIEIAKKQLGRLGT